MSIQAQLSFFMFSGIVFAVIGAAMESSNLVWTWKDLGKVMRITGIVLTLITLASLVMPLVLQANMP